MMMMVHRENHRRPFSSSERGEIDADGPTCNIRPPVTNNNNTYDVDVVAGAAATAASSSCGGASLRALQPFDISNRTNTYSGGMTTSLGFPFTNAQGKELERQAMIYKYMVASLPVPRDLLFPFNTRTLSGPAVSQSPLSSGFNLRLSNSTDPEPGRCKRTDGKKWRCSRDTAPDQKYCEHHMHRGRPRSRKHVEVHANTTATKRVRHDINRPPPSVSPATVSISNPTINKSVCPTQFVGSTLQAYHQPPVFKAATFDSMNSASSDREPRSLDWLMVKGEPVQFATSDQPWHHLMQSKTDAGEDQQDNECNLFLNPDVVSLENPLLEEKPRCFIDAWSKTLVDDKDTSSAPSSGQLSPSSLTLSMGGYNSINEEMGQTQMSLGSNGNGIKPQLSTWLTPASWVGSAPGGPLAEVLKPTTIAASNPSSPNGESGTPMATTVSSTSGVVQKTFASLSDSSASSSPTLASSRVKPEIVSLWLNQNKA